MDQTTLPPFTVSAEYAAKQAAQVPVQPKPGWKSSEFWFNLLALALPAVLQALQKSPDATVAIAATVAAQLGASIYTLSRTSAKNAAANAGAPANTSAT